MTTPTTITVYWRPGCGFCSALLGHLDARGIPHERVNIWDDPAAAARVRTITGGNETVPTVTLGDRSLVNPRLGDVVRLIERATAPTRRWERAVAVLGRRRSPAPDRDDARRRAKMRT